MKINFFPVRTKSDRHFFRQNLKEIESKLVHKMKIEQKSPPVYTEFQYGMSKSQIQAKKKNYLFSFRHCKECDCIIVRVSGLLLTRNKKVAVMYFVTT